MQNGQLLLVGLIVAAIFAISGSKRKGKAFGLIVLSCLIGFGIGAGLGFVLHNPAAGGTAAGLLMAVCGIATSLRQVAENNREKKRGPTV